MNRSSQTKSGSFGNDVKNSTYDFDLIRERFVEFIMKENPFEVSTDIEMEIHRLSSQILF